MANENSISSDLIRGHIDTIILRSLYDGDKHGNEICLDIEDKSGGQYEIKQPTLYSALKRLETSGLVNAYWASGVGGRRRYFKLTDKGREVCEDNLSLWIHSRNVIDKLISDGTNLGYPVIEVEPPKPKFDASEYENYSFNPTPPIFENNDDDFELAEATDYQPLNDDLPVLKIVDDTDPEEKFQAEENENNLLKLLLTDADDIDVHQLSLIADTQDENDEIVREPEPVLVIDECEPVVTAEEITDEEDDSFGVDDRLIIEPYSSPEKEYSDILEKIFPEEKPIIVQPEPQVFDEPEIEQSVDANIVESEYEVKPTVTVAPAREEPIVEVENKQPSKTVKEQPKNPNEIDYTDILSLAQMQGFKVKTAERINHTAKGKLYVNKLSALSATILYALMIVEMISVCLPVNEVLKFDYASYLIGAAGLLLYPLVTYVLLIINPKKTTDRIATFKYSLSVAVVTLLNLILLTFVFALVMQIDLHSAQNLMYYIVIPIIVFMNIPMYYIIKYVLISKGIYFIKD